MRILNQGDRNINYMRISNQVDGSVGVNYTRIANQGDRNVEVSYMT